MSIDHGFEYLYRTWFEFISDLNSRGEALICGVQDIADLSRTEFPFTRVSQLLNHMGFTSSELDLEDSRASIKHDLNTELPSYMNERFDLLFDIGTIEHVADSMEAFSSYMKCVRIGGLICLLTPVCGYFDHGFHTFSEEFIVSLMELNGFELLEKKFCDPFGNSLESANSSSDVLILVCGMKTERTPQPLIPPQQKRWKR